MSDPIQAAAPQTLTRPPAAGTVPGQPAELIANATSPVRGFIETRDLARCVADVAKHDPAAADRLKAGLEAQLMQHSVADMARFHMDVAAAMAGHPAAGARCPVSEPPAPPTFADVFEETVELVHRHGVATGSWNPQLQPLIQYLVRLGEQAQPNCSIRISPEASFDRGAAILAGQLHLEGRAARGAAQGDAWVERRDASALSLREEFGGVMRNGLYGPGIVVVAETKAQHQVNQEARERSRLNMFKIECDLVASLGGKAEAGPAGSPGAVEVVHRAPLEPAGRPVEAPAAMTPAEMARTQGLGLQSPRQGMVIVDLQSGPLVSENGVAGFLSDMVSRNPGSSGVGIESGDVNLAYQGLMPSGPRDHRHARMLVQNLPAWPDSRGQASSAAPSVPHFDPEVPFPKQGRVRILQAPAPQGQTPGPQAFYPPISKTAGRAMPANLKDVGGLNPSTHPELHGTADAIYWRRSFGLGTAGPGEVASLAAEIDRMLKPGGFFELRSLTGEDARRAKDIAAHMPGARLVEVPRGKIEAFFNTGKRPAGLSDEQWRVLEAAGPDLRGAYDSKGKGLFVRLVRIYKAEPSGDAPPLPGNGRAPDSSAR